MSPLHAEELIWTESALGCVSVVNSRYSERKNGTISLSLTFLEPMNRRVSIASGQLLGGQGKAFKHRATALQLSILTTYYLTLILGLSDCLLVCLDMHTHLYWWIAIWSAIVLLSKFYWLVGYTTIHLFFFCPAVRHFWCFNLMTKNTLSNNFFYWGWTLKYFSTLKVKKIM